MGAGDRRQWSAASIWLRLDPLARRALLVAGASLLVRLTWASLAQVTPVSDFAGYDQLGRTWAEEGVFDSSRRTPGYPGFLALVYASAGHSWRAAQIAQAFLGALSSGLVVLLAGRAVAPRTATLAGGLHAVWPTSVAYVGVLASENLAVPLVVGLALAVTAEREASGRRARATAIGGALFGLAVLVRPALVLLLPGVLLLALWEPGARRWRLVPGLAFAVAALLVLAPWQIRNHRRGLGITTVATTGGLNLWLGNSESAETGGFRAGEDEMRAAGFPAGEPARDRAMRSAAVAWITSHPAGYARLCAVRAGRLWGVTPDVWAARFLWPTAENDAASRARRHERVAPDRRAADGGTWDRMLRRRKAALVAFRVLAAPLLALALLVAGLRRPRAFAGVLLPVASYALLLSLTFVQERFREVSDALLLVPLAALVSDLALGTAELGWPRGRRVLLAASLLLVLSLAVLVWTLAPG